MENSCRQATVTNIGKNTITATFIRPEACAQCAAKSICSQISGTKNSIEFTVDAPKEYHIGQQVNLELEQHGAFLSIIFAFGLPLLLMLICLFSLLALKSSDTFAALASLAVLAIYYLILFTFRNRLKEKIKIKLTTL